MSSHDEPFDVTERPVDIAVTPAIDRRNRLTSAFRFILAIPHVLLVGGPLVYATGWAWTGDDNMSFLFGGGGLLGAVAGLASVGAWFAIVLTGRHPEVLWDFCEFYLRWRVRVVAYTALFRDEYPPFGGRAYPAWLVLERPTEPRDRLTVAFRLLLAIPQFFAVWLLGIAWAITSFLAWLSILLTGRYPEELYRFGVNVFRWSVRVEAYLLLLVDEYPPFSFD